MILLIDNYDSFTYNLFQYIAELGFKCEVLRNDMFTLEDVETLNPRKIVISPGPGTPDEAGICLEVIRNFKGEIPILGICLGHQAIGQAFGGKVIRAKKLMHGKSSSIYHKNGGLFSNIKSPFEAMRYHSLVVKREGLPKELEITAETSEGVIMGLRHKKYSVEGLQFHPESYGTDFGKEIIGNFLRSSSKR